MGNIKYCMPKCIKFSNNYSRWLIAESVKLTVCRLKDIDYYPNQFWSSK